MTADVIPAGIALFLAGWPALMYLRNLFAYRPPPSPAGGAAPAVSILIPARDEARSAFEAALSKVDRQKGAEIPVVVGGRRLRTGRLLDNRNPSDRSEVLSRHHLADRKIALKAVDAAVKAQKEWAELPARERASVLLRAAARMRARKHEFSATMVLEIGKSWPEADVETAEAIEAFRIADKTGAVVGQPDNAGGRGMPADIDQLDDTLPKEQLSAASKGNMRWDNLNVVELSLNFRRQVSQGRTFFLGSLAVLGFENALAEAERFLFRNRRASIRPTAMGRALAAKQPNRQRFDQAGIARAAVAIEEHDRQGDVVGLVGTHAVIAARRRSADKFEGPFERLVFAGDAALQ